MTAQQIRAHLARIAKVHEHEKGCTVGELRAILTEYVALLDRYQTICRDHTALEANRDNWKQLADLKDAKGEANRKENNRLRIEIVELRKALAEREPFAVWLAALKDWQFATFPSETIAGVYAHLREEIDELGLCPMPKVDPLEVADCLMLLFCLAFHCGMDPLDALRKKHEINLRRTWSDTGDGHYRHVEEGIQG